MNNVNFNTPLRDLKLDANTLVKNLWY